MSSPILDRGRFGILTPTFARGGNEEYVIALAGWARRKGWQITVGLPDVDGVSSVRRDLDALGISVTSLTDAPPYFVDEDAFRRDRLHALNTLRSHRFDRLLLVLPTIEYGGALIDAAALADVPTVVLYQLVPYEFAFSPIERQIYSSARRRRQRWLTVSKQNRDVLCSSLGWGVDAVDVVPNALLRSVGDISAQERENVRSLMRAELGLPPDARIVLTVARLHVQKAFEIAVAAAVNVTAGDPAAHFVWVGTGELQEELRAQVVTCGLAGRVHMIGHRHDVERLMHASDVFVLPSRFEGMPFAGLEAMAAGLPCVFSDIGPHRELATAGKDALFVPVGDARALAHAIGRLLTERENAARLGSAARRRAASFRPESSFSKLFEYISDADRRHATPRVAWPMANGIGRRVAIYGAGAGGRKAFDELTPDTEIVAFLDSRADDGASLLGRPVLRPEAALRLEIDAVVLASIHAGQMRQTLRDLGYAEDRIEIFPVWRLLPINEA